MGTQLSFRARLPQASGAPGVHAFSGRVAGDSIKGTFSSESGEDAIAWQAHRVGGKTLIGPEVDPKLEQLRKFDGVP